MSAFDQFDSLDDEVKELLQNYKYKKATIYEPCTLKNVKECLIGLSEELGLLNINYVFNPHTDVINTITNDALVKLINSVWTLLHYHKNLKEKSERLIEENHTFENNNKQLHGLVNRLKEKVTSEKNEAKACVASVQRISDNSDVMLQKLTDSRTKVVQLTKQKETTEKSLRTEISRLKMQNEKLLDRIRNKSFTSCSEGCDVTMIQLKEREKHQRGVIAQLQKNNQELLRQILDMKEMIILEGLQSKDINDE